MMIDTLVHHHRTILRTANRPFKRYFLSKHRLENRFSIISGQRGVGKTTAMIQYIHSFTDEDILNTAALYVPVDHFLMVGRSLYETAQEFVDYGGQLLCLDEIHKYPGWSGELKSIYDSFPDLRLIVSGSSALGILKGSHDLSRRAVTYQMTGMSLREFIALKYKMDLPVIDMADILENHDRHSLEITGKLENQGLKILPVFEQYLRYGYFPYFLEHPEEYTYFCTLEQGLHTTIESDLPAIHPGLSGAGIQKLKRLLAAIARSAPFTPDMKRLKQIIDIGDERTLKTYLVHLDAGKAITCLQKANKSIRGLEKPEKIYLNNPNQAFAICDPQQVNPGTIRELFFICMVRENHPVTIPSNGDFQVDGSHIFEVGGKGKTFKQIKDLPDSYLAVDGIEHGMGARIPLWLFGFLY
jgi:uncharacterized protein